MIAHNGRVFAGDGSALIPRAGLAFRTIDYIVLADGTVLYSRRDARNGDGHERQPLHHPWRTRVAPSPVIVRRVGDVTNGSVEPRLDNGTRAARWQRGSSQAWGRVTGSEVRDVLGAPDSE